jgi:hypothetical protein
LNLKEKVSNFFCRDDINSYQAPGKRDSITVKRNGTNQKIRKRYLLYSLNEVFHLFSEENLGVKISCSSFKQLRPLNVLYKPSTPHNVCVCLYHENISLLLQALSTHTHGLHPIELNAFVKLLVCDDKSESCMFSEQYLCRDRFQTQFRDKMIDADAVISWTLWSTSILGRIEKIDHSGTVNGCVAVLRDKIRHFLFHVFVKRQQADYFCSFQEMVSDNLCLLQMDYSENFSVVEQNEIQSAHWSKKQLLVFTAHLWIRSSNYPMVIVSDDPSHSKWIVSRCIELILHRFHLKLSWRFFATSHGKGNGNSAQNIDGCNLV